MQKNKVIGKKVKLVFKDRDKVLIKQGIVKEADVEFVTIDLGEKVEVIPTQRVIRMEIIN